MPDIWHVCPDTGPLEHVMPGETAHCGLVALDVMYEQPRIHYFTRDHDVILKLSRYQGDVLCEVCALLVMAKEASHA
jgi:hypothetical protein